VSVAKKSFKPVEKYQRGNVIYARAKQNKVSREIENRHGSCADDQVGG
jgi:hypothetical protein